MGKQFDIDELDESAERDAAKMRAELADQGDDGQGDEEGPVEEEGGDDEEPAAAEGDGDDDEGAEPTRRERPSREERRRERGRMRDENEQLRRELAELRASQQTMMHLMQRPPQAPQAPERDDLQDEWRKSWAEQKRIAREYQRAHEEYARAGRVMPPEEEARYEEIAQDLEVRRQEIAAERMARRAGISAPQPQGPQWVPIIQHSYRDVLDSPEARIYAEGRAKFYLSQGESMGPDLYERTLKEARQFVAQRNSARQRPTDATRARLSGRAAGAGGSSGGAADRRRPGSITPDMVARNKELRKMADTVYEHEPDEKKRYKMFAEMQAKSEGT